MSDDKCQNRECTLWPFYQKLTKLMSQIRKWLPPQFPAEDIPCIYAMMSFNNNGNLRLVETLVEIPFEYHVERQMEEQGE